MATTKILKNTFVSTVQLASPPIRTKKFDVIKDAGILEYNPYLNYGDISSMILTPTNKGKAANIYEFAGFDIFHTPKVIERIFSVKLNLTTSASGNSYGHLIKTYDYKSSGWFETSITWYHAHINNDANIGDLISEDVVLPYQRKISIDITDYFVEQMKQSKNKIDLYLTSDDKEPTNSISITARENKINIPQLVVQYYDQPLASVTRIVNGLNKFSSAVVIPDMYNPRPEDPGFYLSSNEFNVDSTMKRIYLPEKDSSVSNQFRISAYSPMKLDFFDKIGNTLHTIDTDTDVDLDTIQKYMAEENIGGSTSTGDIDNNSLIIHIAVPDVFSEDQKFLVPVFSAASVTFYGRDNIVKYKMSKTQALNINKIPNYYKSDGVISSTSDLDIAGNVVNTHGRVFEDVNNNAIFAASGDVVKDIGDEEKGFNKFSVSSGAFAYRVISINDKVLYNGDDFGTLAKYSTIIKDSSDRPVGFSKFVDNRVKEIDSDGDVGTLSEPNTFHAWNHIYGKYNPNYPDNMPELSGNTFKVWKGSAFKFNFFDSEDAKLKDAENNEVSDVMEVDDIEKYSKDANTKVILSTGDIPPMDTPMREETEDGTLGKLTGNGLFDVYARVQQFTDKNRIVVYSTEGLADLPSTKNDNNFFKVQARIQKDTDNTFNVSNDRRPCFYIGTKDNLVKNPEPYKYMDASGIERTYNYPFYPFREGVDSIYGDTDNSMNIHARVQEDTDNTFTVERPIDDLDINSKFFVVKGEIEPEDIDGNTFRMMWKAPFDEVEGNQFRVRAKYKRTFPSQTKKVNKFYVVRGEVPPEDIDGNTFVVPYKTDPKDPNMNVDENKVFVHALYKKDFGINQFGAAIQTQPVDIEDNEFGAAKKIAFWYFNPDEDKVHKFVVPYKLNVEPIDDNKFNVNIRINLDGNRFRVPFKEAIYPTYGFIM